MKIKTVLSLVCLTSLALASDLLTKEGHEVPEELLSYFDYTFDGEPEEYEGKISSIKRKCHHKYDLYCQDSEGNVNKDRLSQMKEEYDMKDYTQEEFCDIILETCNLISFKTNPLTGEENKNPTDKLDDNETQDSGNNDSTVGEEPSKANDDDSEKKLLTKEGHEVPEELLSYFDYSFDGEPEEYEGKISSIKRKCHHKYDLYCQDSEGNVNKDRLSQMKEEYDMKDYTQEEFCDIILETCNLISFKTNPLTGEENKNPTDKLDDDENQDDGNNNDSNVSEEPDKTIEENDEGSEEDIENIDEPKKVSEKEEESEDEIEIKSDEKISSKEGKCGEGYGACKEGYCCSQYGTVVKPKITVVRDVKVNLVFVMKLLYLVKKRWIKLLKNVMMN